MHKFIKILSSVVALVLIGGVLCVANSLVGNPISKMIAERTAKQYIEVHYPQMALQVSNVSYSFKDGCYYAYVTSPTSRDTYFSIHISQNGKVRYDSYESNVVKRWNTYERIDKAYRSIVEEVFESEDFPYESDIDFGELKIKEASWQTDDKVPLYGIEIESLELDKEYNIKELGQKVGNLIFYTEEKAVSAKRAAEILLDLKAIFDEKEVPFYAIEFVLQKPRSEDEKFSEANEIRVKDFLYSDIYEEGLEQRVEEMDQLVKAYYKEQDRIKQEEAAQYEASLGKKAN